MNAIPYYQINNILKQFRLHLEARVRAVEAGAAGSESANGAVSATIKRDVIVQRVAGVIAEKLKDIHLSKEFQDNAAILRPLVADTANRHGNAPLTGKFQFAIIDEDGHKSTQTCLIGDSLFF